MPNHSATEVMDFVNHFFGTFGVQFGVFSIVFGITAVHAIANTIPCTPPNHHVQWCLIWSHVISRLKIRLVNVI